MEDQWTEVEWNDLTLSSWDGTPNGPVCYMPVVDQVEILEEYRRKIKKIVQGESSVEESRKQLEYFLNAIGYAPESGPACHIKDLRSARRMHVILRTNVQMLQGWGQKERGMRRGALAAFPAWELICLTPSTVPGDWLARWIVAGGVLYQGRMIAMKTSEVWQKLGNFKDGLEVDYPPFAWGSGMGWKPVGYRESQALGVIPTGWVPPAADKKLA